MNVARMLEWHTLQTLFPSVLSFHNLLLKNVDDLELKSNTECERIFFTCLGAWMKELNENWVNATHPTCIGVFGIVYIIIAEQSQNENNTDKITVLNQRISFILDWNQ